MGLTTELRRPMWWRLHLVVGGIELSMAEVFFYLTFMLYVFWSSIASLR